MPRCKKCEYYYAELIDYQCHECTAAELSKLKEAVEGLRCDILHNSGPLEQFDNDAINSVLDVFDSRIGAI